VVPIRDRVHPNSIIQILLNPSFDRNKVLDLVLAEQSDKSIYMYLMTVACAPGRTTTIVCETKGNTQGEPQDE
jgi:hypothetical protein